MNHAVSLKRNLLDKLPDSLYLRLLYFKYHKRWPKLYRPTRYTEKIMWLKLHGHLERYTDLADKYSVRGYIGKRIGNEYLIPMIGSWESASEIPFENLPKSFVLKVTHGCGYNYIVRDKSKLDLAHVRTTLDEWMKEDFYKLEREPQYKYIKPRIICEEYLEDETGQLRDFKFYCGDGEPRIIQIDVDRFSDHKSELRDPDWVRFEAVQCGTFSGLDNPIPKPRKLKQMLEIASKLAAAFPMVRVDLYLVRDKIYFGELTFTPGSGLVQFEPAGSGDIEFSRILGFDIDKYRPAKDEAGLRPVPGLASLTRS